MFELAAHQRRSSGTAPGVCAVTRGTLRLKRLCPRGYVGRGRARYSDNRVRITGRQETGDVRLPGARRGQAQQLAQPHVRNSAGQLQADDLHSPAKAGDCDRRDNQHEQRDACPE